MQETNLAQNEVPRFITILGTFVWHLISACDVLCLKSSFIAAQYNKQLLTNFCRFNNNNCHSVYPYIVSQTDCGVFPRHFRRNQLDCFCPHFNADKNMREPMRPQLKLREHNNHPLKFKHLVVNGNKKKLQNLSGVTKLGHKFI